MFRCLAEMAFFLANLGVAGTIPQLSSNTIDLRQWGYPTPPKATFTRGEIYRRSHLLSIFANGAVVAGFVAREGDTLSSRTRPDLTLLTVTFDRRGHFCLKRAFRPPCGRVTAYSP